MAKEVRRESAGRFLEKARQFYESALEDYQKGRYDACIFQASQAVILANDALCIAALGQRASMDHREAARLHLKACKNRESKKDLVVEALDKRNEFGYTEKESGAQEANLLLVRAKRFLDWVRERVA